MSFDALVWQQWFVLIAEMVLMVADIATIDAVIPRKKPGDVAVRTIVRIVAVLIVCSI